MDLRVIVQTKIQKPVKEVFEAVYNPKKLSSYFTSGGADGPLDEGKTVTWNFKDEEEKVQKVPVKVQGLCRTSLSNSPGPRAKASTTGKPAQCPTPADTTQPSK